MFIAYPSFILGCTKSWAESWENGDCGGGCPCIDSCWINRGDTKPWFLDGATLGETTDRLQPGGDKIGGDVTNVAWFIRCGVRGDGKGYGNELGLLVGVVSVTCPMRRGCLLGETGTSLALEFCCVAGHIQSLLTTWFGCVAIGRRVGGLMSLDVLWSAWFFCQ